jgi:hypothetical protein
MVTKTRHQMNILSEEGDTKIEWDPDNKDEVKQAERTFDELIKKGYKAFEMCEEGNQGDEMEKFDKNAERILFVSPMTGG